MPGLIFPKLLVINLEFLDPVKKGPLSDAQIPCSLGAIAVCPAQGIYQQEFFINHQMIRKCIQLAFVAFHVIKEASLAWGELITACRPPCARFNTAFMIEK